MPSKKPLTVVCPDSPIWSPPIDKLANLSSSIDPFLNLRCVIAALSILLVPIELAANLLSSILPTAIIVAGLSRQV